MLLRSLNIIAEKVFLSLIETARASLDFSGKEGVGSREQGKIIDIFLTIIDCIFGVGNWSDDFL
ncbi:MAG: hypothetical protein QNJ68_15505 [Microcoleaceae cyanobacterium MO_207.B10]|nr:hypothetical protein [Microcoleaceae cyanobacterium MO_207.B10]